MDYEKKYKQSLALMGDCIPDEDGYVHVRPQDIFPELTGPKDERIRKTLIRFHKSTIDIDGIKGDEIVSWLEKQGEQKPTDEDMKEALRTEYEKGRADAIAEIRKKWDDSKKKRQEVISFLESLRLKED